MDARVGGWVERLTEKAEQRLKLIERMSTGRRAGGESRSSSMRGRVRESVHESVAECPNTFSPHSINLFAGLLAWPGVWRRVQEEDVEGPSQPHPVYHQTITRESCIKTSS